MFHFHCTRKLLERIKPVIQDPKQNSNCLGAWYATALFWKPQLALLVNERTLLPVLMPLAPAASLAQRFPQALAQVLNALEVNPVLIQTELSQMTEVRFAKTANRKVLGIMNEFTFLIDSYRNRVGEGDLLKLSLRLAHTPCSPLYKTAVFPDQAVRELFFFRFDSVR
jgi:hypothetical protein